MACYYFQIWWFYGSQILRNWQWRDLLLGHRSWFGNSDQITSISILFLFLPILLLEPISRNLTLSLNLDLFSKLIFRKIVKIPDWALRSYTIMERTLSSIKCPVESPEGRKKSQKGMWASCGLLATTEWSHLGFSAHPDNP